jgi:hypothetical protein
VIRLPVDDRFKIDLAKPVLTLDVNQIALRPPAQLAPEYLPLLSIEWNYFETGLVEAAVTPETAHEITKGIPDEQLGSFAYQRLEKSRWFKARPSGSTLSLDVQESNELWLDMRQRLWPTLSNSQLNDNQRADVSQLFFHAVSSGSTVLHSAFVTLDHNFLGRAPELRSTYGVTVMTPGQAWTQYHSPFHLVQPTSSDIDALWRRQNTVLARLRSGMR